MHGRQMPCLEIENPCCGYHVGAYSRRRYRGVVAHREQYCTPTLRRTVAPRSRSAMDLPSAREIELETLLRERDAQVAELTVSSCDVVFQPCGRLTRCALGRGHPATAVPLDATCSADGGFYLPPASPRVPSVTPHQRPLIPVVVEHRDRCSRAANKGPPAGK